MPFSAWLKVFAFYVSLYVLDVKALQLILEHLKSLLSYQKNSRYFFLNVTMKPDLINLELLRGCPQATSCHIDTVSSRVFVPYQLFCIEFTEKINKSHSIKTCSMKQIWAKIKRTSEIKKICKDKCAFQGTKSQSRHGMAQYSFMFASVVVGCSFLDLFALVQITGFVKKKVDWK